METTNRIRVFHLEDYLIMREGIQLLLQKDKQIQVVGAAQSGDEFFRNIRNVKVDVLLLDIYLDGANYLTPSNGYDVCKKVRKIAPGIKVVAHSKYDDADRVARIMNAGAGGFVSKNAGVDELINAIKQVSKGSRYICSETAKRLKNIHRFLSGVEDTLESKNEFFSKREREVLQLLADGFSSREIAEKLFISEKTVESHRKNLVEKARVRNTVELIAYASLRGFIKK